MTSYPSKSHWESHFPTFSSPLIIPTSTSLPPASTYTLIFLHGRGDTSTNFAPIFLTSPTSASLPLSGILSPTTRIIFPTCLPTSSPTYHTNFPQWFDIYHTHPPVTSKPFAESQCASLMACVQYIHAIIEAEIALGVAPERIFLGGLSQGMGAAFAAAMTGRWKLGGLIGISGWWPMGRELWQYVVTEKTGNAPEVVKQSELPFPPVLDSEDGETLRLDEEEAVDALVKLRRWYQLDEPDLDKGNENEREEIKRVLGMRVWIGHGDADTVVRYQVGRGVWKAVKVLGMEVEWRRYGGLGHWWRAPEEVDDVVGWMMRGGLKVERGGEWFHVREEDRVAGWKWDGDKDGDVEMGEAGWEGFWGKGK